MSEIFGQRNVLRVLGAVATLFAGVMTVWFYPFLGLLPGLAVALFGWSAASDAWHLYREWLWSRATPLERGTNITLEQAEDGRFRVYITQHNVFPNERTVDFRLTKEQMLHQIDGMMQMLHAADQNNE